MSGGVAVPVLTPDVLVIGAGPAGLVAAERLARRFRGGVLVLDREQEPGGAPRHCLHTGFGLRDLRRLMTGPQYARRLVDRAVAAGADLRPRATVTGWPGERRVTVTSPEGLFDVEARAVVLATGARERPRAERMIPGDRPAGVWTTGQLQKAVHQLGGRTVGRRAVVVGAEPVSWSAVLSLRAAGCATVLMTTQYPRPDSYAAFALPGRALLGVPVATRTRVTRIVGAERVEAVEVEHLGTGERRRVGCDTVILSGDWVPEHEIARLAGLELDGSSGAPVVDTALRTSSPGVFAAGNLLHPVDTADVAALDGRHVADQVERWFRAGGDDAPRLPEGIRLVAEPPLRWLSPGLLRPGDPMPPRGRLLAWTDAFERTAHVRFSQDGRVIAERPLPWPAAPGRVFRIPSALVEEVDFDGGPVSVALVGADVPPDGPDGVAGAGEEVSRRRA